MYLVIFFERRKRSAYWIYSYYILCVVTPGMNCPSNTFFFFFGGGVLPYTAVSISHPPRPSFPARYLHSWDNSVGAKKVGAGNISPRAFRRRIVRSSHPLGCRAIELGKSPEEGVIMWHTPSYTVVGFVWNIRFGSRRLIDIVQTIDDVGGSQLMLVYEYEYTNTTNSGGCLISMKC